MNNPNMVPPELQRKHQFMTMLTVMEICLKNSLTDFNSGTVSNSEAATFESCMGKMAL